MHSIKAALRARSLAGGCCPSLHDGSLHAQLLPQCRQICHTFLLFFWEECGILFDQVILVNINLLGRSHLGNSLCIAPHPFLVFSSIVWRKGSGSDFVFKYVQCVHLCDMGFTRDPWCAWKIPDHRQKVQTATEVMFSCDRFWKVVHAGSFLKVWYGNPQICAAYVQHLPREFVMFMCMGDTKV